VTLVEAKKLMTPKEVAESLSIGLTKCYHLISIGQIPSIRVGRSLRVVPDQLEAWISAKNEK